MAPYVPGAPGVRLPDPVEEVARLRRELRDERQATEHLIARQGELVREKSMRPPPTTPAPEIVIQRGNGGWRVNIPWMLVAAIVSAFLARAAPTPTQEDTSIRELRAEVNQATEAQKLFREGLRTDMAGWRQETTRADTDTRNRLAIVEAELRAVSRQITVQTVAPSAERQSPLR